jgi:regulator of replication initiation timing
VTPREQRLRQRIDQLLDDRAMLRMQVANLSKRLAHHRGLSQEVNRQRRRADMWETRAGGPYALTSRARATCEARRPL